MTEANDHPVPVPGPGTPPPRVEVVEDPAPPGAEEHGPDEPEPEGSRDESVDGGDDRHDTARKILQAVAAALVLALFAGLGWFLLNQKTAPGRVEGPGPTPIVEVVSAQPEDAAAEVTAFGEVRPRRTLVLSPRVEGRVEEVHADLIAGGRVPGGTVVVRLDSIDFESRVRSTEANLDAARASREVVENSREEAQARVAAARQDVADAEAETEIASQNYRESFPDEPVPDLAAGLPRLRAARARLVAALAAEAGVDDRIAEAEARIESAEAAAEDARTRRGRTELKLPGGSDQRWTVARQDVAVGRYATPRDELAVLYDADALEAVLPVTPAERALLDLSVEPRAILRETSGDDRPAAAWPARIVRAEATLDPRTRLTRVVADVLVPPEAPDPADALPLLPGSYIEATITGRTLRGVYGLPAAALRPIEEGPAGPGPGGRIGFRVWTFNDDTLGFQEVELVQRAADRVLVRGLRPGDRVVTTDLEVPTEGMAVRLPPEDGGESAERSASGGTPGVPADEVLQAIAELREEVKALKSGNGEGQ